MPTKVRIGTDFKEDCGSPIWPIGSSIDVLYDGVIALDGSGDEAFMNSGTMTSQFFQRDETTTVGSLATGAYVASSDGDYVVDMPIATTALLVKGDVYKLKTIISVGADRRIFWITRRAGLLETKLVEV